MKKKPLKISWKAWCLYKLAKRDFSVNELTSAMRKRAFESDQEVDPDPIIQSLLEEGLLDDERLIQTMIQLQFDVYGRKGPLALKREFETKKKIDPNLVSQYLDENDKKWEALAERICLKVLRDKQLGDIDSGPVPRKIYDAIHRKLITSGFKKTQIDKAMTPFHPVTEVKPTPSDDAVKKSVEKRMNMGKGPKEIQSYLRQQKVEDSVIREAMNIPDEVWVEVAAREKEKKFGTTPPKTRKERQKQIDFLLRRGFLYDHAGKVVNG